jgi:predicted alpha/beta-fold hydrolase
MGHPMTRPIHPRLQALRGHAWTLRPWIAHQLQPVAAPEARRWTTVVRDARMGDVRLHGWLADRGPEHARAIVLLVHGLGGSSDAPYIRAAARAADRAGMASLRLDLRGAPGDGEDLYNAGLTEDLRAALASPAFARFERVHVLGYSLGGHLTLLHATEAIDPRVRSVAAVCPPVDLDRSASAMDEPKRWVYRHYVLGGLKDAYAAFARRRARVASLALPSVAAAQRIGRLRTWDDLIIAPRFGFRSAEHYYATSSVAPRLGALACPALVVSALHDPMVPEDTVRPALSRARSRLDVRWIESAGHVGFPRDLDLGLGGETGLEPQILRWLSVAGGSGSGR